MRDLIRKYFGLVFLGIIGLSVLADKLQNPPPNPEAPKAKKIFSEVVADMKIVGDALVVKRHPDGSLEAWVSQESRRLMPKLSFKKEEECTIPGPKGSLMLAGSSGGNVSFVDMCTGSTVSISPENVTITQSLHHDLCQTAHDLMKGNIKTAKRPKFNETAAQSHFNKKIP